MNNNVATLKPIYMLGPDGTPVPCVSNVVKALTRDPHLAGAVYYDSFRAVDMLTRPFNEAGGPYPRPLQDFDLTDLQDYLDGEEMKNVSTQRAMECVGYVARKNARDPLKDHIADLPEWDGVARLDSAPQIYLAAEESELHSAFFRCFAVSMIARAMQPGCKVDTALVLEGPQGCGKSTAAAILGGPFFSDVLPSLGSKDAQAGLRGQWVVELAELSQLRTNPATFKGFLSRQVETYRPAYGRKSVHEPRRAVFVGTTNDENWLTDPTGGRRFWPIRCGAIDLIGLQDDRDQLLAEAKALFDAGEPWTLPRDLWSAAADHVAERQAVDPWRSVIEGYLIGRTVVTTDEVLGQMISSISDRTPAQAKRVAGIMMELAWTPCRYRSEGKRQRGWRKP